MIFCAFTIAEDYSINWYIRTSGGQGVLPPNLKVFCFCFVFLMEKGGKFKLLVVFKLIPNIPTVFLPSQFFSAVSLSSHFTAFRVTF